MAAAENLAELATLLSQAPETSAAWSTAATGQKRDETPKRLAERIVAKNDLENRNWLKSIRKWTEATISYARIAPPLSDVVAASANLMSAHITQTEAFIERDRLETQRLLQAPPAGIPISAIRIIARGLDRAMTERHESLVALYYQLLAEIAERDESARPSGLTFTDPDALEAFLAGTRGD